MRAGRPVVYLNALSERDWLPFATRGAALGVHGLDELAGAVRRTLSDSELRRGLSGGARTLVADALETVGADAGRRVAELCETMMAAAASRRAVNETACV
jgi:hypothetical protein